ncbi:MAG: hypothetical protein M3Z92_07900 [Bacteroidota bacterium]|nr:hypothetical protein [Bacteroidota bacterium]MDQ6889383.1 hypothetical protein [Bacteroidota bacterium]
MKKNLLLVFLSSTFFFFACEKGNKEKAENLCPIVAANLVPQVVKDSFALRYPATNVTTWFNKDSVAFCAYFITSANVETLAQFSNNGSFIKEEIENHQDGQHEDSTGTVGKVGGGCECEVHKEGD